MEDYTDPELDEAHDHSYNNKGEIKNSNSCGCFYCCRFFAPRKITDWADKGGRTALCPYCGIDSVLGDACGFALTDSFLRKMNLVWFSAA